MGCRWNWLVIVLKSGIFKLVVMNIQIQIYLTFGCRGRDIIVGIMILYGLDVRQDILYSLYLSRPAPKPTLFLVQWVIGLFSARKA
jgi:hypothetical protein